MKNKKAEEEFKREVEERRREKARQRRKNWKERRMPEKDKEEEEGEVQQGDFPEALELEMIAGLEDEVPKQNKAENYFPESQPGGKLRKQEQGEEEGEAQQGDFPGELELELEMIDFPESQPGGKLREGGRSPALAKEDFPGKLDLDTKAELDDFPEDLDQELLEGLPVWSNTPHILSASLEKLGGGDLGWGGVYQSINQYISNSVH